MTIEQRKIDLINWINSIQNEAVLEKLETLKERPDSEIPDEIFELLNESSKSNPEEGTEHTTALELLGR